MNAKEIEALYMSYQTIKHKLRTPRAFTLIDKANHMNGKTVISTCIIPIEYSLDDLGGYIQHACVPTMGNDLTKWQKLVRQSSSRFKSISVEDYLNLPLWSEDMLSISCEVVDRQAM